MCVRTGGAKGTAKAADNGAELVVFTETFIPGYPAWIWRLRPGADWDLSQELHQRLLNFRVLHELCDPRILEELEKAVFELGHRCKSRLADDGLELCGE